MTWSTGRIAKTSLGKYIIGATSLLHLGWGILLCISAEAGKSTPVDIFFRFLNRPTIVVLFLGVSLLAILFLRLRLGQTINARYLSLLLLPQQFVLLCSAGSGILATILGHYADGVARSWTFILADQLPSILIAVLYTTALIEIVRRPIDVVASPIVKNPILVIPKNESV